MWGNLAGANFNVTTPYTGPGLLQFQLSQFNNWSVINGAGAVSSFGPAVNMAIAGQRTLKSSGASGAQVHDKLALPPNPTVFLGASSSGPNFTTASGGSAEITVELIADQGIPK